MKKLLLIILTIALVIFEYNHLREGLYAAWRSAVVAQAVAGAGNDLVQSTDHFRLYYPDEDASFAEPVLAMAEKAYSMETKDLAEYPAGKLTIIMYPDQQTMSKMDGLPDEPVVGLYGSGVISLPYPGTWIPDAWPKAVRDRYFFQNGPMAHELTHMLLDYKTDGNYPAWFTEGLAQDEDRKITGYVWTVPGDETKPYTYAQLNGAFYALPDQALAYRQALGMVNHLVQLKGQGGLRELEGKLAAGVGFPTALQEVYGLRTL